MKYYLENIENVIKELNSDKKGLTSKEVEKRIEINGKNKLSEGKKEGLFKKILKSLADPMIIMLLITAIISGVIAKIENDSFADVFVILFVVIINTIMGLLQESKAEKAIESLKNMTAATSKVLRDGKMVVVKSEDLTIGDIVLLEAGDQVPSDCRIIESFSLQADESALTGESTSVSKIINFLNLEKEQKDIGLADRKNMLYSGSTIAYGRGKAIVTSIGMNTELGKIAKSLQDVKKEKTELQKKMSELSKTLTKIVLLICALVFFVKLFKSGSFDFKHIIETTLLAVALAVAAIPEGLPAVVTVILSIGVTSMSKKKALIRKLNTIETLGCVQVICSDKTGTLTKNKMTVVDVFTSNSSEEEKNFLVKGMAICSDSKMKKDDKYAEGEPTENGLVEYANSTGLFKMELDEKYKRIEEIPFDSARKMMTTINKNEEKYIQYTKGAFEIILDRSKYYLDNGEKLEITDEIKEKFKEKAKEFASRALRILGLGYNEYEYIPKKIESSELEKDLIFVGFVGMIDPCRDEVFDSIKTCKSAGIRTIMITGDHIDTAVAIAKQLSIIKDRKEALTGLELNELSDEELEKKIKNTSVFARVEPSHKTRIVNTLQKLNYITAMTGDGVNDAPSIKKADVGIAMGITGTDVTKGASDVIIADDNFATIVNAVEEGRKNYDNIKKLIQFQLSTNMAEVLVIFIASLFNLTFLTPTHLLWINMITDSAPGLALGAEPAEDNLMKRKPRPTNDSIFSEGTGIDMIWQGIVMTILVTISYFVGVYLETGSVNLVQSGLGLSMAFITMNFSEIFEAVSMRSQKRSIFTLKKNNLWLLGAVVITSLLTILVVYLPFFVNIFGFTKITFMQLIISIGIAFVLIPTIEIVKFIKRKFRKEK